MICGLYQSDLFGCDFTCAHCSCNVPPNRRCLLRADTWINIDATLEDKYSDAIDEQHVCVSLHIDTHLHISTNLWTFAYRCHENWNAIHHSDHLPIFDDNEIQLRRVRCRHKPSGRIVNNWVDDNHIYYGPTTVSRTAMRWIEATEHDSPVLLPHLKKDISFSIAECRGIGYGDIVRTEEKWRTSSKGRRKSESQLLYVEITRPKQRIHLSCSLRSVMLNVVASIVVSTPQIAHISRYDSRNTYVFNVHFNYTDMYAEYEVTTNKDYHKNIMNFAKFFRAESCLRALD